MRISKRLTQILELGILGSLLIAGGCEKNDLGKPCGTLAGPTDSPVEGEQPVIEVVRVERDSTCESFRCLTHMGLTPYCTRPCTIEEPAQKIKACTQDSECVGGQYASGAQGHCKNNQCTCETDEECKSPTHCEDGQCRDDDCPEGYWCKRVQDVGPSAAERYCVFRDVCRSNSDCEEFGVMACQHLGCFDACERGYATCPKVNKDSCNDNECYKPCVQMSSNDYFCPENYLSSTNAGTCSGAGCFEGCVPLGPECEFHRLICEPLSNLQCECLSQAGTELSACPDDNMQCQPDSAREPWDPGDVKKRDVCQPEE